MFTHKNFTIFIESLFFEVTIYQIRSIRKLELECDPSPVLLDIEADFIFAEIA